MNERNEVEQQKFQSRQSKMKKEKKTSKTESRFKSKFESFIKLPHKTSANSAIEKARSFFRSLDFKHRNRPSHTNEDNQKKDLVLNPPISQIEKINPRDMIVHRVDDKSSLNYFQQKYKQYLKPTLLIPKQYYNDILNQRYPSYSPSINRYELYPRSPVSTLSPNFRYHSFNYSFTRNEIPSHHFRPFVCREIESPYSSPIIPSSSSMLTWNQCVRRLNKEYRLTIDALEQAKECLEQVDYTKSLSHRSKNLLNNETKKTANVTFCLPSLSVSNHSKRQIEQNKTFPSIKFCKPKLVKPVELNTFFSPMKIEPILTIIENNEKLDSIANIIKKFNDLNSSLSPISDQSSELISTTEELQQDETIFTVETFYKTTDNDKKIDVITEEQFNLANQKIQTNEIPILNNTTSPALLKASSTPLKKSISLIPKRITTANVSHIKQPSKVISSASKLKPPSSTIADNTKTSIQNNKNQKNNILSQPSSPAKKRPSIESNPTSSNRVKSMIHQINSTTPSRPSINPKQPSRSIYGQSTTSTNKNPVQRK